MGESLKERQENELEALQAIFMDDFCDLNSGVKYTDFKFCKRNFNSYNALCYICFVDQCSNEKFEFWLPC